MIPRSTVAAVAFTIVAAGCAKKNPCPPEKMSGFFEVSPKQAISAVREFCSFPSDLADLLKSAGTVSPENRASMIATALSKDMSAFKRVCSKAKEVFNGLGNAGDKPAVWMYDQCGFGQLGLLDRAEIAKVDFDTLWISTMVYGWMKEEGVKDARRIGRHMLALE